MVKLKVKKRSGKVVPFDAAKIKIGIVKASASANEVISDSGMKPLLSEIRDWVKGISDSTGSNLIDVETIEDIVEKILMKFGFYGTAKDFIVYRYNHAKIREVKEVYDDWGVSINAMEILKERYLLDDETPLGMLKRVSMFFSKNKKEKDRFYEMFVNKRGISASPSLFNAGTPLHVYSPCLTPDQEILSSEGFREIENVNIGDLVVSHTGMLREVTNKFVRDVDEDIYKIKIEGLVDKLSITSEHPVWSVKKEDADCDRNPKVKCNGFEKNMCRKEFSIYKKDCKYLKEPKPIPKWNNVKDLKVGDYVAINTLRDETDVESISVFNILNDHDKYLVDDGKVYRKAVRKDITYQVNPVNDIIPIDNEFMRLAGYYLSEGNIHTDELRFTLSDTETDYADEIKKIIKNKFGLDANIIFEKKNGHWLNVECYSVILIRFFNALFGKGFNKKRLPPWMLCLPREKQENLLDTIILGDGCVIRNGGVRLRLTLANEMLSKQMWIITNRLNFKCTLKKYRNVLSTTDAYDLSIDPLKYKDGFESKLISKYCDSKKRTNHYLKLDNKLFFKIKDIKKEHYKGKVMNLEVDEDNTYIVNGVVVHNCFTLGFKKDSLPALCDTFTEAVLIESKGGGIGFNLSNLREKGAKISTTNGVSSGILSWLKLFDFGSSQISQGGRRRGANMAVLNCMPSLNDVHPELLDFVSIKMRENISTFNLSVLVDDYFMNALEDNDTIPLISPHTRKVVKKVPAQEIFNMMVLGAHTTGDPGMLFYDRINEDNFYSPDGKDLRTVNPCSEFTGLVGESCDLGSLNLAAYESDEQLAHDTETMAILLNRIIDKNRMPFDGLRKAMLATRKIGIGIMGLGDYCLIHNLAYGSEESLKELKRLLSIIKKSAISCSEELVNNGVYPEIYDGRCNANLLSIAPTGTIATFLGCTSGIEPPFGWIYERLILDGSVQLEKNEVFKERFPDLDAKTLSEIKKNGSIGNIDIFSDQEKKVFRVAFEIPPAEHLAVQAAAQELVDLAISKTIILPESATIDDIKNIFLDAWKQRCKGITVYRNNSKDDQPISWNLNSSCRSGKCDL